MKTRIKRTAAALLALLMLALAGCSGTPAAEPQPIGQPAFASDVVENEACRVTLTTESVTDEACTFGLKLANNSDSLLTFIIDAVGFNGTYLFSESFTAMELVDPGASVDATITVGLDTLAEYGITELASADFSVVAIDETSAAVLEDVHHYAMLEDAAPAAPPEPERAETVLDQDGLRVTIGGGHVDAFGDYAVLLRCENDGGEDVQISMEQFRYNGHEADEYTGFLVPAGGSGYAKIWISADVLALMDLSVDDLTELSFELRAQLLDPPADIAEQSVTYALK